MLMVCAGFQLLESQYGCVLCGCNFMFEQLGIYLYYGCSIRLLPDWVFQNYVAHGVPSGLPTRPDGQHALLRWIIKHYTSVVYIESMESMESMIGFHLSFLPASSDTIF